jgi:hypothetical protein
MALPTALLALVASFGLAAAAIFASVDAQNGTRNDSARKDAIAAADAGVSLAQLRLNRFQKLLDESTPCIGPMGEALSETAPGSGWCPPVPEQTVGGGSFTYQMSAYHENAGISVVSVGTYGTVKRRVEVGMISYNGKNVFADENLIGQDQISLEGDVDVETDIGTNGDIVGKGNAYLLCGDARHGIGKVGVEPDCNGEVLEGNKELPEVNAPSDIATNNSNCRLVPNCTGPNPEEEIDTYIGPNGKERRTSTNPWDPTKRTINVGQGSTLSMGGSDYFVCGLYVNGGELIMLDNAHVRIFIDTPEDCGYKPGETVTQVSVTGNGVIKATGYIPEVGSFDAPGIYVMGSSACAIPNSTECIGSKVVLDGTSGQTNELVLYAPFSEIDIGGNATWIGMVAGKSIRLHGNPHIVADPGIEPPDQTLSSLWERTHYVECTGGTASPPDLYC